MALGCCLPLTAESNLDVESKLTVHYQAPWHQQRNVFLLSTRPACVEELHRGANHSLWGVHLDHSQRRSLIRERRVTISALPPMPLYPPSPSGSSLWQEKRGSTLTTFDSTRSSSPTECCRLSPWSRKAVPADPDTDGVALGHRSKFPIPNIPSTLDKQTNWSRALPLPTPEERMKSSSQVINSCVIPINVTGVSFDRDASVRCSLVHSQSLLQRRRKLRRRRTVAGIPRQVQHDLDSDDSPGSRERTVIVHARSDVTPSSEELSAHLNNTRDSGCQTEDFLIAAGAPSRRRIRSQRGQGAALSLSRSAGNITCLTDGADVMFASAMEAHLRSRSLPRDGSRMAMTDNGRDDTDEDEDDAEVVSSFDAADFLSGPGCLSGGGGEESADEPEHPLALTYQQLSESRQHRGWTERPLPCKAELGSCEISSSSDTFGSPVHSVSAVAGALDHKDDHQSSSGNWSGSSSTCPSQTSETLAPAASPPLTGSSHCDSELSLNAAAHAGDEQAVGVGGFLLDQYQGLRSQRAGSFSSTAMDILEEAGLGAAPAEGDCWSYSPHTDPDPPGPGPDFGSEPGREAESSLGCPSYTSMATCESSYSDKPPSEKADTVSHYSVDTEGYYTSMHFDCGLKGSRSFTYSYGDGELGSGHLTLGRRCLSLRKPKAKPSPPKRSSSLRKICSEENDLDRKEPKISCGQQPPPPPPQLLLLSSKERKLHMSALLGSSGHLDSSREPLVAWGVESAADLPDLGVLGSADGHSFKDEGAVQSDYADLWLLNDLKASDPYRSLSNSSTATGTTVVECVRSQESSESQTSGSRATTPSLPSVEGDFKLSSPEKLAGLASPSSGYSSQSETPTSSFPSAFFPGPASPASGKRKPKVPERKSSLSSLSLSQSQSPSSGDGGSDSKRDLELPIVPPSHLDLSSLQGASSKASAYRNQIQMLQNKQRVAAALTSSFSSTSSSSSCNPEAFGARCLSITPTALHSVQLRSVGRDHEGGLEDKPTPGPQCRSENPTSTLYCSDSPFQLRSPPPPNSHRSSSKGSCESMFTSSEELADEEEAAGSRRRLDGETQPLMQSEDEAERSFEEPSQKEEEEEEQEEEEAEHLSDSPQRPNRDDDMPAADGRPESLILEGSTATMEEEEEECESSGASSQSPSQDGREDETEESFSKDSTPNDVAVSPLSDGSRPEDEVFLSPTRSRTTEDLFAVIHRSKRKVLGRKDSGELGARTRLAAASGPPTPGGAPSSPVQLASPPVAVTPPGPHRVTGPIYRNAKKSTTSSEEFKLLLLKKGSRSDSSYRMSATEILRSPVSPKPAADPPPESPRLPEDPASPLLQPDQLSSPFARANATEGLSPKSFPTSAASRQGRPRIPPPANSSRYGMRSRLYSAPMQAISEGETENSDGSPHDDRSS
ncbi:actin remodeling regulator NHS isoform X2 [Nelusetta ayraudi]|uniref:actin remodeling regulator NHS isoform X2 n=1 Tax=Nelusetta ayraudi TaxID=303726 RepID=UPI003F6EA6A5